MRLRWSRALLAFLLVWLAILIYLLGPLMWKSSDSEEKLAKKLWQAQQEVQRLSEETSNLRTLLKKLQEKEEIRPEKEVRPEKKEEEELTKAVSKILDGPSKEYENAKRQIEKDVNEMWWLVRSRLEHTVRNVKDQSLGNLVNKTLKECQLNHKAILASVDLLDSTDGYGDWRLQESKQLSDLVQKRLHSLQNPKDCSKARKLLCNLNKGCGYGCQVHHAIYCFIVAYGTERTLILKSKGWRYNKQGFEQVFHPLSDTCTDASGGQRQHWPGKHDTQVVEIPIVDSINPKPKFLPPAIPADLADRIVRIHGDPVVWWVAEFLKYFLKPQAEMTQLLQTAEEQMEFAKPIVGIHVRRTDKVGTEAAFHPVEEYMKYVEEYYQLLEVKEGSAVTTKRVYVASDDPKVLSECRKKFPDYTFLGDPQSAKSAAVSSRYTSSSLKGIVSDIHMLSRSDYLVCTFSSQVCRIAYEHMQHHFVDAALRFKSLDDIWYFGGQDEHQQVAVMAHEPASREEIEMRVGDVLGVAGNHWNGFNKGRNHRNSRLGLYPQFKTREKLKIVDFPTYPHVEL